MINILLDSSRNMKRTVALCYDLLAIPVAIYLAISLRYGYMPPPIDYGVIFSTLITTLVTATVFVRLGLYRAVVRFMTAQAFSALTFGVFISALTLATSSFLLNANYPRSSIVIIRE